MLRVIWPDRAEARPAETVDSPLPTIPFADRHHYAAVAVKLTPALDESCAPRRADLNQALLLRQSTLVGRGTEWC